MPQKRQAQLLTRHAVRYGSRTLPFSLARTERRTLGIEVHPDQSVHVVAPVTAPLPMIEAKVVAKGRWLVKQFRYFEQFLPRTPPPGFECGATHRYLGRRYTLKVRDGRPAVKLSGPELLVTLPHRNDRNEIRRLVTGWYHDHARRVFNERMHHALPLLRKHKIGRPEWRMVRMEKRWGSCTPSGRILLNPELITMPRRCIDYVIIHELCHLVHPYHDRSFYALQERAMPDWERWKGRLEASA